MPAAEIELFSPGVRLISHPECDENGNIKYNMSKINMVSGDIYFECYAPCLLPVCTVVGIYRESHLHTSCPASADIRASMHFSR